MPRELVVRRDTHRPRRHEHTQQEWRKGDVMWRRRDVASRPKKSRLAGLRTNTPMLLSLGHPARLTTNGGGRRAFPDRESGGPRPGGRRPGCKVQAVGFEVRLGLDGSIARWKSPTALSLVTLVTYRCAARTTRAVLLYCGSRRVEDVPPPSHTNDHTRGTDTIPPTQLPSPAWSLARCRSMFYTPHRA